jgi:glutamate racemase
MNNNPIGIFDSGIGGLTVAHEIINTLPNESIVYLGDTARVPYGTRDKEVIREFALELTAHLLRQNVKALVIACNTISATCLEEIKKASPVPVIDVIEPTVLEAIQVSKNKNIGVIGTHATIESHIYEEEVKRLSPQSNVYAKACPLFVPLAEEGFLDHPSTKLIAEEYLSEFKINDIDTLILGCTHYPLLKKVIQEVVGDTVTLIDSARPTAEALQQLLVEKNLLADTTTPEYKFYVTNTPELGQKSVDLFFGDDSAVKLEKIIL